ncbi:hypothetical protein [Microbulbifer agarilyticus]
MSRRGIAGVVLGATVCIQGCIFLPYEDDISHDPFFFSPESKSQRANFVEVGNYLPNSAAPQAANQQCATDSGDSRVGSACWFFPVMRVY